jgi:hypothetical protein
MEDLFGQVDTLPVEVRAVIAKFLKNDEYSYESCQQLVFDLEELGYTCDYGLDASPYNLTKL